MKTLLTLLMFTGSLLIADANTDWVDAQIKAIKPPRVGVSTSAVNTTKNPFLFQYKKVKEGAAATKGKSTAASPATKPSRTQPLRLYAVMNNSALISGSWYKTAETVRGYKVSDIKPDSVMLRKGSSQKMLFITNENKNIKIQVK